MKLPDEFDGAAQKIRVSEQTERNIKRNPEARDCRNQMAHRLIVLRVTAGYHAAARAHHADGRSEPAVHCDSVSERGRKLFFVRPFVPTLNSFKFRLAIPGRSAAQV